MFGDLLGNMEEQQKQMQEKLGAIIIETEAGDGLVKVTATANKEITNISISPDIVDKEDVEQVEDLVLIAVNRAIAQAVATEAAETEEMMKNMMPPGLGGLSGLFG